ncbi:MAG TPA: xanthine dehydrogenase family protein subunit M [Terriglobales bacterium]|nr:xanthine dehydrogenase family protein subunit M [Terriglobales bacterium]
MRDFDLVEPTTLGEACVLLADDTDAKAIAGGTALLTILKQRLLQPKRLVNLKKVRDGAEISFDQQTGLHIGALATINEIETSPLVRRHYPAVAEACHLVANIRIRNMATLGGNLAHADYQSDPPTVLTALDARVEFISAKGSRALPLAQFQLGVYETALAPGELISAIRIPPPPSNMKGLYVKFTTGSSEERPCAGVAAFTRIENGICRELRLAVGAVSPRPLRITVGEERARNQALSTELVQNIAAEATRVVEPIDDLRGPADYKRHLVGVLVRRAVTAVANGALETTP